MRVINNKSAWPVIIKQKKNLGNKASDLGSAMDALARLVAGRERSIKEALDRLTEKGFTPETTSCTIERAVACGLLDDQRFAQGFIKDKLSRGWGRRRIEQELYRFGIAKESIEGYPDDFFSEETQVEAALQALKKHRSRAKNPRQAAYQYLVGKGYSSDIAVAAIDKAQ
jgi:regulatory protein